MEPTGASGPSDHVMSIPAGAFENANGVPNAVVVDFAITIV
jgi:hypothetical protein